MLQYVNLRIYVCRRFVRMAQFERTIAKGLRTTDVGQADVIRMANRVGIIFYVKSVKEIEA